MHNLPARPTLDEVTKTELKSKTAEILQITDVKERKKRADELYKAEREKAWFLPVTVALSGVSRLCMYCSFGETSEVEHYRPKATYPEQAFRFENYLWVCSVCNRYKSNTFPTEPESQILNPFDDKVWDYFFLDDFGRLQPEDDQPRAFSTCEIVRIDRQSVQNERKIRFRDYEQRARRTLNEFHRGELSLEELQAEIKKMRSTSTPMDVADYFLKGPGRVEEPFKSLLLAAGEYET